MKVTQVKHVVSEKWRILEHDLQAIGRTAFDAGVVAVAAYLIDALTNLNLGIYFGEYAPVAGAIVMIFVKAIRKFITRTEYQK